MIPKGSLEPIAVDRSRGRGDSQLVNEAEGTALLATRFTEAGYAIVQNFHFHEGDIAVDLDGWDAVARVGYEYITSEAGDYLQFDPATLERFEARMEKGELAVLLVDEHDVVTAEALDAAARGFLAFLAERRGAAR
jgi:hypothetical protein